MLAVSSEHNFYSTDTFRSASDYVGFSSTFRF